MLYFLNFAETKENTPPERKKQRPNKRKKVTDSRQDLVKNETLVSKDEMHYRSIDVESCPWNNFESQYL